MYHRFTNFNKNLLHSKKETEQNKRTKTCKKHEHCRLRKAETAGANRLSQWAQLVENATVSSDDEEPTASQKETVHRAFSLLWIGGHPLQGELDVSWDWQMVLWGMDDACPLTWNVMVRMTLGHSNDEGFLSGPSMDTPTVSSLQGWDDDDCDRSKTAPGC